MAEHITPSGDQKKPLAHNARGRMRKSLLVLFFFVFIGVQGAIAMSLFDIGKTCVFSEVKGRIFINGQPVKNAKVVRQWDWNERRSDETVTDELGRFQMPSVHESSLSRLLPTELVIGQQLSVEIDGTDQVFWTNSKREPEENAEYGGADFNVLCDLSHEERLIEEYGSLMVTMCTLEDGHNG